MPRARRQPSTVPLHRTALPANLRDPAWHPPRLRGAARLRRHGEYAPAVSTGRARTGDGPRESSTSGFASAADHHYPPRALRRSTVNERAFRASKPMRPAGVAANQPEIVVTESLRSVCYRYWFWEWLFVDLSGARDLYQRTAAWRHNVDQRRYLPLYMRRWLFMSAANLCVAAMLEKAMAWTLSAALFYTNGCVSICVLGVTFVGWLLLGQPDPRGQPLR